MAKIYRTEYKVINILAAGATGILQANSDEGFRVVGSPHFYMQAVGDLYMACVMERQVQVKEDVAASTRVTS